MNSFQEFKIETYSFTDYYFQFILLASDLEYLFEMIIQELKNK